MKVLLVAVFDTKLGEFNNPMSVPSLGVAQRSFQDEVNRVDANNTVNKYPDDFSLYHIADYDTITAEVTPIFPPLRVVGAADLKV